MEKWCGFMDVDEAKQYKLARPVKIPALYYSVSPGLRDLWRKLDEGEVIQGCITPVGVYAVTLDGKPRVIKNHANAVR